MDGMKNIEDELGHAQSLLAKARTLTDEAITLGRNPQEIQKAFETLAGAAQSQNAAFENLRSAITRLCRAVEKSFTAMHRALFPGRRTSP
jgi:hypothetical protein